MCMLCAAIPVAAAIGTSLDNRQRKKAKAQGRTPKRIRPFMLLTIIMILLLLIGLTIVHLRYYQYWL